MRLLSLLLLLAVAGGAQERARLRGRVVDADGRGVAVAAITVRSTGALTLSDSAGRFLLEGVPPGQQVLEISRIGFATVLLTRTFGPGAVVVVEVVLRTEPIRGDTLRAAGIAVRPDPRLEGFDERRLRGGGYFFTAADVRRMQAYQFTDILRRVPGMYLQPVEGPYGQGYLVQMRRSTGAAGARPCPVLFFVNGTPFPVSFEVGIDNFIRPDDVAGVEVYPGAARLPPQFSSTPHNSRCGVVAIWTRVERRSDR